MELRRRQVLDVGPDDQRSFGQTEKDVSGGDHRLASRRPDRHLQMSRLEQTRLGLVPDFYTLLIPSVHAYFVEDSIEIWPLVDH